MKRQLPEWMLGGPINHQSNTGDSSRKSCDKDVQDVQAVKEPKQIKKRKQPSRDILDDDIVCERVEKERKGSKNKRDQTAKIEEKAIETVEPLNSVQGKPTRPPLVKCKERKNVSSCGEEIKNKRDQTAKMEEKAIECENKETADETMNPVQGKPPRHPLVKCKERKVTKENVFSYGEEIKNKMDVRDVASTDGLDDEDDIDLTVEDLMIIANEYIQEDNNSKQVETSKEEHKSVSQFQGITDSSTRGVHSVAYNSNVVDPSPTINGNSFDSENPTQSMLDLFLGPWLKKPQAEEKKSISKTSDLDFDFDAYKQKSVPVAEKPLTSTRASTTTTTTAPFGGKKKSSLKDKVSMFLD